MSRLDRSPVPAPESVIKPKGPNAHILDEALDEIAMDDAERSIAWGRIPLEGDTEAAAEAGAISEELLQAGLKDSTRAARRRVRGVIGEDRCVTRAETDFGRAELVATRIIPTGTAVKMGVEKRIIPLLPGQERDSVEAQPIRRLRRSSPLKEKSTRSYSGGDGFGVNLAEEVRDAEKKPQRVAYSDRSVDDDTIAARLGFNPRAFGELSYSESSVAAEESGDILIEGADLDLPPEEIPLLSEEADVVSLEVIVASEERAESKRDGSRLPFSKYGQNRADNLSVD